MLKHWKGVEELKLAAGDCWTSTNRSALRQSEANYRNLLQTANSVIIRYDPQGRIRYINDYGVKFLGYEEHQILGRTLFETIIPDIETSGRDVKPFIHDLLRTLNQIPQNRQNLCRDGWRVWVAWSNKPSSMNRRCRWNLIGWTWHHPCRE